MSRRTLATAGLIVLLGLLVQARPGEPTQRPPTRPVAASIPAGSSWTTYHHDNGHTGYDAAAPALGAITTTPGWTETALDGQVYAEPLAYAGVVYATTLNNTVYALRQTDGTVLWRKNLGTPVSSGWQCGNVSPQGILGTGVLDTVANRIYVATILNSNKNYYLFGLDLGNSGNVVLQTDITTAVPGFDWTIEQDLGSAGPLRISPNLLFQAGKWGGGFLLDPTALGGVDGQLFPTPKPASYSQAEVCFGNHSDATFGSFAYAAPYVYLECEGRG